jgi:N-acetylglucosaminyl-diphospho-decaprenol L-rhamnosyltransferase
MPDRSPHGAPSAPVAIAVVSWNTRDLLARCLRSLAADARAGRAAVTVLDNASADGSAALVAGEFGWARLIASPRNLGFGAAVNRALAGTRAPWLACANADVALLPGALERLLDAGERHPEAGILAPRLIDGAGGAQHSVHPFPTLPFTLAFNLGLTGLTPGLADRFALDGRWNPLRARRVDWALGAFLLIRRSAWEATGGFDEGLWMYAEDLDLAWRAARAGFTTWYEPGAQVRHAGAASTTQAWGDRRRERWLQSTYAWMLRRRGAAATAGYATLNVAGALGRAALLTPLALPPGSGRRGRHAELRGWARAHASALRAAWRGSPPSPDDPRPGSTPPGSSARAGP